VKINDRDQRIRESLERFRPGSSLDASYDFGLAAQPVGHLQGLQVSTQLTHDFRHSWRLNSMNITPQQVIEVIVAGGVQKWVLMGLHGCVGYLSQPRATQDVDIMVDRQERDLAVSAILQRWPQLEMRDSSIVVRFVDPGEAHAGQMPQGVIDIMLPNDECQLCILNECVHIEPRSGHRLPTREAALAAKYSALISPYRDWVRKSYDAGDLRSIILAAPQLINRGEAYRLGELIFPGGGNELLEFIKLAIDQKPFPV
jgi:hypothetical protein